MSVVYGLNNIDLGSKETAVAVGVFDGVHWGHRAIFRQLTSVAADAGLVSTALTFDRNPTELLAPQMAPKYISTLEQRIELIQSAGVENVVVAEFDHYLANIDREEFLKNLLVDKLHSRHIVVGSNFRFGKSRAGDIRYLNAEAPGLGMKVTVVPSVIINDGPVSSTRIRNLVSRGEMPDAEKLLGRRFTLRGTVITGRQIGRKIGFPTANIAVDSKQLIPARGVYAVEAAVNNTVYAGVCNIGSRPTFANLEESIEVHLMGFDGNLYGKTLDVVFCRRLRDEMKFESPEKLVEQIQLDIESARNAFGY